MSNQLFKKGIIPSVNFHLWEPCNMRCKFCFATFQDVKHSILPKGHMPKEKALEIVKKVASFGFEKITFVGGEPTLCPWLSELITTAKQAGLITMIVSNGSNLTDDFLSQNLNMLDWITISIDSLDERTNIESGRAKLGKVPLEKDYYFDLIQRIQKNGYQLKINTVVHCLNYQEDMSGFILSANPNRWKLFQVLPVLGQNDMHVADFIIENWKFEHFLNTHNSIKDKVTIVPESNELMTGTYVMIDPAGRFFDNTKGYHSYSPPILDVGIISALRSINTDFNGFLARDGYYY